MIMYRKEPPPPMSELSETEVPFDLGVESIFYYEVHERPSKWAKMQKAMAEWWSLVSLLRESGLSHTGFDYPDWRQFAPLDLSLPARMHTRTRLAWYDNADIRYDRPSDFFHNVAPSLGSDPVALLAMIRSGLDAGENDVYLYTGSLIHCKHVLISGDKQDHDTLLPAYVSAYSLLLSKLNLHCRVLEKNMFWAMHSTLHLWSYEVGQLEKRMFEDQESWMLSDLALLLSILTNDN